MYLFIFKCDCNKVLRQNDDDDDAVSMKHLSLFSMVGTIIDNVCYSVR